MSDLEAEIFSDYRTDVIGFDSTWLFERTRKLVDKVNNTDPVPAKCAKSTETNDIVEIGIQTDAASTNMATVNEQYLATWLKNIYPLVEKELLKGPTYVFDMFDHCALADSMQISAHQVISTHNDKNQSQHLKGCAAWMSLSIMNAPILAVSVYEPHNSWCVHSNAELSIFVPIRNATSDGLHYERTQVLSVMSCLNVLCTNPFNKDMLGGGTFTGDIVVWRYERSQFEGTVNEHASETSQFGCVVSMAWMQPNDLLSESCLLSAHIEGIIVCWRVTKTNAFKEQIFAIRAKSSKHKDLARLSTIAALTGSEFVVGTEMGQVLLCSTSSGVIANNYINPVVSELQPHIFGVRSIQKIEHNRWTFLVSSDVSGEVLIRNSNEEFAWDTWEIIKMPMKLRHRIDCTIDLTYLLAASDNGALDIVPINGQTTIRTIAGLCTGEGNTVAVSENRCWAITGCYNGGQFQLFSIQNT